MVSHRLPNKNVSKNKALQAGGAQRNDWIEDVGMFQTVQLLTKS